MSITTPQQGIVSILESDHDRAASLRRTLSADMSSKKWLTQNGFSNPPMKRIASSEELNEKYDNHSSHKEGEAPSQDDIWSLIVSKKAKEEEENSTLPPPYIHPLVRRSTSSLSEKSLELCTESLGSETGSDKFSSYNSPSETGDAEEEEIVVVHHLQPQLVAKFNITLSKKSSPPPKSFPPPLPSLAPKDGPSLHMQPRREDGRLVLEAVAIPSQNCFSAHRENGRLRLTFSKTSLTQELNKVGDDDDVEEKVLNYFEEEKEEEEEETYEEDENELEEVVEKFKLENYDKEHGIVINQGQDYSSRVIYVHRSALMMKNLMGLSNRDPKWSTDKLKKKVDLVEMELEMENYTTLSQSLPRPTRMAKMTTSPPIAASFNAYEYFWTSKPIIQEKSPLNNYAQNVISPKINRNKEMELLRRNKGDYLVPLVRGCNENYKKSLLFWEPYCIATS